MIWYRECFRRPGDSPSAARRERRRSICRPAMSGQPRAEESSQHGRRRADWRRRGSPKGLTLCCGERVGDIVDGPHATPAESGRGRPERFPRCRRNRGARQPAPEGLVHQVLETRVAGSLETFQDCGDIVVERQRRSHASEHSCADAVMSTKVGFQRSPGKAAHRLESSPVRRQDQQLTASAIDNHDFIEHTHIAFIICNH